ncbi:MAG: hypothetical protein NTY01_08105 [Verrucomicrobia bacterium]|nr:hypothetical protein [Verrucomicrobiota bacterium]
MDNFNWLLDKTVPVTGGAQVRVLRRDLTTSPKQWDVDLAPFFAVRSLFQWQPSDSICTSVIGLLARFEAPDKDMLVVQVSDAEGLHTHHWQCDSRSSIVLSIWRIDDVLDCLQLKARTNAGAFYAQTGGARLIAVFDKAQDGGPDEGLDFLLHTFNAGIINLDRLKTYYAR